MNLNPNLGIYTFVLSMKNELPYFNATTFLLYNLLVTAIGYKKYIYSSISGYLNDYFKDS